MAKRTMIMAASLVFLSGLLIAPQTVRATDTTEQRQQHEKAAKSKIDELNSKMDQLAAETRKAEGQARDEMNRLYEEFKGKQATAGKDLEEMRKATNEEWDKAKVKMNKAIEELNGIYERAKAGSKKEEGSPNHAK